MDEPLVPRIRRVHLVRWMRADRPEAKHRYFARAGDARTFQQKLAGYDIPAKIYVTRVGEWQELP